MADSRMIRVNQRENPPIDGVFISLGQFEFGKVEVGTGETNGYVTVDAVQFLPVTE
ncbi:MAG: hypothetical protein GY758_08210 [Fuerstiella sp.]|nr:hypothetical protein [Fuerstiella sp.]MCP4505561.1 hypothetical protein [Fuerstiella sp.]